MLQSRTHFIIITAVVRVPHSLNTGKSVLTAPAPLPLPSATASLAAEGTAELQLPAQTQMNSAIAVETRTAAFLRSGEAVPQLPARASWAAAATAPTCSSYSLAGIPTAAGVTMSIKYPQGAGRCLSQTNDRGIGCSCSGASRVKTEGGGVESRGGGGAGAAMDNDNDRVSHCANILRCLPQPCDSVSQMPAQHGQLLMKAIGGSSTAGTGPIVPRHMAAPLPHHRPSTPPQPQITHQHRMLAPTSSASIDAGLNSSGCLPVDPLATSTFSTLGAVPLVLTNPQRPSTSQRLLSSQLPSLSRTAPAQATSTVSPAAPSRISIDDPLCPINRAHGRRRALTAATSCVETSPIGIGSLWDLPRTTMSFRIRETLCTQLHKTSSGGRVRTDDAGDAWDVASGPQQQGRQLHSQPEQQRQQQQPQVQQPQQRQLRSIQASACTARAFAFALSLGTSPLGPHSASSIGGPFPHTSMPLILAQKKQEQEQERGEQQLAQQQDQNPITQQREKRQQQLGVWLVRHDTNTQQASSSLHSAAAGAASQTTAMASCDKPSPKMDFTGMHRTAARDSSEPVKQADVSMSATPAVLPAMISATRTTATTATLMTRDTIDGSHGTGVDGEFPEMYMFNSHQDHPLLFTAQEPDPAGSEAISHQQTWYRAPIVAERNVSSTRLQHLLDSEMRRPVVSSSTTTRKRFTNQQGEVPTTLLRLIADATISNVSAATAATVTTAHADADADDAKPFVMSLQQQGGVAAADDAAQRVPRRDSLHNSHLGPSPDFGTAGFRCNLLEPPREPKATADLQLPPHPEQPLGPAPGQRWEGECWHEVWMMPAKSPLTGEGIIIIKQIDVTAKVIAERHLALVMETEHRLVEQLFPRHILQYITEEWTAVAAAAKAAAEGQTPPPPTGDATAAMRRSHFGQHQHQPWGSDRWLPAIRNCTALATSHAEVTLLFADIKDHDAAQRAVLQVRRPAGRVRSVQGGDHWRLLLRCGGPHA
ncbi:hypothetical protein Vretifemale_8791 [Volvox reticuliferus]|uniref:Uncharacterized protein n=1 Tax=Volvox reticuliferus TaxID=1737510 RepID=A0A8J4FK04_9CHLO|nr:hypothetical protein Vretifemale_8791 [Volvox reticuliferus]